MRPLNRCHLSRESVPINSLFFGASQYRTTRQWLTRLQNGFHKPLLQDRFYMSKIEENMCIAALDQGDYIFHSIDGLRIILAHHFNNTLNVRELPVSLLRLYFSGHQHFKKILNNIKPQAYSQLLEYLHQDYHEEANLTNYIQFILDATFCSFERTLILMTNYKYHWPDFGLKSSLDSDSFWTNMPTTTTTTLNRETHLIYYALMWRINVTLQIEKIFKPWEIDSSIAEEQREWLLYRMKLFRDTHLDLSTLMIHRNIYNDIELQPFIGLYWPTSDRVCCLEELPDLSQYSLDNLKTGTNLKERSSLKDKYGHFYFNKGMNNICGDRNYYEIYERYSEQDQTIADVTKLNSRCMLLGNTPKSRGQLNWIARVRINFTFWPSYVDVIMSEEEIQRVVPQPRNPFLAHKKKLQTKLTKAKEKGIPEEQIRADSDKILHSKLIKMTRFGIWVLRCAYLVSSLMREYLCVVLEEGLCVDEFFALDYKWNAYKEIIRIGNGHCRNEITLQCSKLTLNESFDWFVIEYVEKLDGNNYANKRGKIMEFHDLVLDVTTKVLKRDFIGIIKVKATATEKDLAIGPEPLEPIYGDEHDENRTKPTLEEIDFIAWYMAQNEDGILETRWFQVLGISEIGIEKLRDWYFRYQYYEPADDSFKADITGLQIHRHDDYFIIMSVIVLIIYHRKMSDVFYTPLCMAKRVANAMRKNFNIADYDETPPLLGVCYRCFGCQKFACSVVPPLNYRMPSNYCELVRSHNQIYYPGINRRPSLNGITNHNILMILQNHARSIEQYRTELSRIGQNRNTISLRKSKKKNKGKKRHYQNEDEETKRLRLIGEEEEKRRRENISFLTIAFYNIHDGKPYCIRNKRKAMATTQVEDDEAFQPIMTSRHNNTIIEVNRPLSEIEILNGRDDLCDFDAVTASQSDNENEDEPTVYIPEYEHNMLLINPKVSDLYRLQLILEQNDAEDKIKNAKTAKATKKKRIADHITSPLNQLYNCRRPLQSINAVGIIIGNKTRCVECGVMTEINEYNMTSHGVSCMRHINRSFTKNHPVWDIDIHNITAMNHMTQHEQKDYKQKKLHHSDILNIHYIMINECDFCHNYGAKQLVAVYNTEFKLLKRKICKECYRQHRNNLLKTYIIPDPIVKDI